MRKCKPCGEYKTLDNFVKDKRKPHGRGYNCYECAASASCKKRTKQGAAGRRDRWLKSEHGINLKTYEQMLSEQKSKCLICFQHQSKFRKPMAVDHCHKTNKIRGLLCEGCNMALGQFKDDPNIIQSAFRYILNQGASA